MNIIEEDKYTRTYVEPSHSCQYIGTKTKIMQVDKKISWLVWGMIVQSILVVCLILFGLSDKTYRDEQADRMDKKIHYMISVQPSLREGRPYSEFMYDPSVMTVVKPVNVLSTGDGNPVIIRD